MSSTPDIAARPPGRAIVHHWEDFVVGSPREFGAMPVTREAALSFARDFDPQPFHTVDAAAAQTPSGRLAASGWHICAMAMCMMCDAYVPDSSSLGSPGIDHLRWLKPVFPGDTPSMRLTVLAAPPMNSRRGVGLVQSRWEVFNQQREAVLSTEGRGHVPDEDGRALNALRRFTCSPRGPASAAPAPGSCRPGRSAGCPP